MAQGQSSSAKGNPAHKRMSNATLKAKRSASWSQHKRDAVIRDAAQDKAHKRNLASLDPTPWERAKAKRAAIRAADPAVQRRVANSRQAQRERAAAGTDDHRG